MIDYKVCYRERKSWIVPQVERCLWTAFENLLRRQDVTVERFDDRLLEFSHDVCALNHFPVDVVCELRSTSNTHPHSLGGRTGDESSVRLCTNRL